MNHSFSISRIIVLLLFAVLNIQLASAARVQIKGQVSDCEKRPLHGALISVKKTKIRTVSDENGNYTIKVPNANAVLCYSYVGYKTKNIKVSKKKIINVTLEEDTTTLNNVIMVRKPVIYLYPRTETAVSVKIDYSGKLLFTYPAYNDGWDVIALPNGKLTNKNDGREYHYLFWDGEKRYNQEETVYNDGFIVHKDSVVVFLQQKLPELGLKPHEYNDFITFWTPYLMKNDWNFIHFRVGGRYDVISKNIVKPQPDTEIRIFMDFRKIEKHIDIKPQKITTPTVRKGFTLVEWGGAELKQPITINTKSGQYMPK